jgi:hypothetical protein
VQTLCGKCTRSARISRAQVTHPRAARTFGEQARFREESRRVRTLASVKLCSVRHFGLLLVALSACSSSEGSPQTGEGGSPSGGSSGVAGSSTAGTEAGGAGGSTAEGGTSAGGVSGSAGVASGGGGGGAGSSDACSGEAASTAVYPETSFTPDADTVAWYKLADLADSGTGGLTLTNTGNVSFTKDGLDWSARSDNAVARFDGSAQSLTRSGLTVGSEFTLDVHLNWRGFRNRPCGSLALIVALTSGDSGFTFGQRCGVAFGPRVRVNNVTDTVAPAAFEDLVDNSWHWLRFVVSDGKVSFLLDGTPLGAPTAVTGLGTSDWTLQLGSGFFGDIDEVRLSKKALTEMPKPPTVIARPTYQELAADAAEAELTATLGDANAKVAWSKISGPGNVVFSEPNALTTHATFCAPGKYVLQAIGYSGTATNTDEVVVRVWPTEGRKQPYKVLFLGNSFTFYNGTVGYRLWELAKASGEATGDVYAQSPFVKVMTSPGQPFQYHWYEQNSNGECTSCPDHILPAPPTVNLTDYSTKYAQDVIAGGEWDAVVLHTYSTGASRDVENFFRYGKKLDRLIKRSGARTVFYETWAYPGSDNTAAEETTIFDNYEKLAADTGAAVSRVGRAFKDARDQLDAGKFVKFPGGMLFSDDKHPSSFGTYLAASVHFGVIYGKSPVPVEFYPGAGDISTPLVSGDQAKADKLRTIAAAYAAEKPLASGK